MMAMTPKCHYFIYPLMVYKNRRICGYVFWNYGKHDDKKRYCSMKVHIYTGTTREERIKYTIMVPLDALRRMKHRIDLDGKLNVRTRNSSNIAYQCIDLTKGEKYDYNWDIKRKQKGNWRKRVSWKKNKYWENKRKEAQDKGQTLISNVKFENKNITENLKKQQKKKNIEDGEGIPILD